MTRTMARRLREGLSTFIQMAMLEESMKNEVPTVRIVPKNEGGKLPPGWVGFDALSHPTGCYPLEESQPSVPTRPSNHNATRPGASPKASRSQGDRPVI